MLIGLEANTLPQDTNSVLQRINKYRASFWLTGSRFFGGASFRSDYDFFAQDSVEKRSFLTDLGFVVLNEGEYAEDSNNAIVYRAFVKPNKVDVQLVKSFSLKLKAQEAIKARDATLGLSKLQARRVWKLTYDLLKEPTDEATH